MDYEPGTTYDCPACGETHTVERGKGLEVAGFGERLSGTLYVRCPEAGYIELSEAGDGEPSGGDDPTRADETAGTHTDDSEWP